MISGRVKKILATVFCLFFAFGLSAQTIQVQDEKGLFTIDKVPTRIVALEYSFVDALANVGVSPVGVADDNDETRILKQVRDKINPWKSVGARSQPSLEVISLLKPDLIIADISRHDAIYAQLQKIAPVLMLRSKKTTYEQNLKAAQKIGDVVGKSEEMEARIIAHRDIISKASYKIKAGKAAIATSRENKFVLYTTGMYVGQLLEKLGFEIKEMGPDKKALIRIGLEQLSMENPDILFIAHHKDESIVRKWVDEPLWKGLSAVKKNQVYSVDAKLWTRARGMLAAEQIVEEVTGLMAK